MGPRLSVILAIILLVLSSGATAAVQGQKPAQRTPTSTSTVPDSKEDKWWAAQRSIEAAIQQLETYLRETPHGNRAVTARQQLVVLRNLSLTAARPEWSKMDSIPLADTPDWRVASVDRFADKTRVLLEIRCERQDGGNCHFLTFDRSPLILVDSSGQYSAMLESTPLPANVKRRTDGQALISGGRTLNLTVDFAPLQPGMPSGQIYYRDNNQAQPAAFSMSGQP
jgi:hypothetical protein